MESIQTTVKVVRITLDFLIERPDGLPITEDQINDIRDAITDQVSTFDTEEVQDVIEELLDYERQDFYDEMMPLVTCFNPDDLAGDWSLPPMRVRLAREALAQAKREVLAAEGRLAAALKAMEA